MAKKAAKKGAKKAAKKNKKILDRLWDDPDVRKWAIQAYSNLLRVRHAFRSHFAPLDPHLRDYPLPDFMAADQSIVESTFLTALEDDASGGSGPEYYCGSKAPARFVDSEFSIGDLNVLDYLKYFQWHEGEDEDKCSYSNENSMLTPPQELCQSSQRFPDPFIYFAHRRITKRLLAGRVLNVERLVRKQSEDMLAASFEVGKGAYVSDPKQLTQIYKTQSSNSPVIAPIRDHGHKTFIKTNAARIQRDSLYGQVLGVLQGSLPELANFLVWGGIGTRAAYALQDYCKDQDFNNYGDYFSVVRAVKALRNRFDDQKDRGIGATCNRRQVSQPFLRLQKGFLAVIPGGEVYQKTLAKWLAYNRRLVYAGFPGAASGVRAGLVKNDQDWPRK
jgi:hypothetical protein